MDEELIILENEEVEDLEQSIEQEEISEIVEVEAIEEVEIEVDEAVGWVGGDNTRHYSLAGRDEADQHPIGAITGLRAELDEIESLQTVYSDKRQQADYYLWRQDDDHILPIDPYGLFVSVYLDTDNIQICDETSDVFGVTVSEAAFVGGQEYAQAVDGIKTGRDGKYCLVVNSGLVGVRRESAVAVGDYVVPNSRGEAKKSEGDYGYLVTALSEVNGVPYAIISLSMSRVLEQKIAETVQDLSGRMNNAEYNMVSITNVVNSAYALAKDAKENTEINSEHLEEKITEVIGRMDKIDGEEGIVDNWNQSINNACTDAALAKTIANNAVSSAKQMGDDAYASANEAITAIKDISAGSTSWAKRINGYSIGLYSQAYGLTWEQAKSALEIGIIYIPTEMRSESYIGTLEYIQKFLLGYYYEWNGERWTPSLSVAVKFSSIYVEGSEQTPYWVVTDADVEHNDVIYKFGNLYKWENGTWNTTGASVEENTLTRAISAMHQTANELSMEVSDIKGDVAKLDIRVDENEATVQTLAEWTGNEDDKHNLATTKVSASEEGASIALVVVNGAEDGEDEEISGARIILNDSEKGSYIQMDADHIDFTAGDFTVDADHINFTSTADYSVIAENITMKSDNIEFTAETDYSVIAGNINLDGYVTFENLETEGQTIINGGNIKTDKLSAISANLGTVNSGNIQTPNYMKPVVWGDEASDVTEDVQSESLGYAISDDNTYYIVTDIGTYIDENLIIPSTYNGKPVMEIKNSAFHNCSTLTSIEIPSSIKNIGSYAFANCTSLIYAMIGLKKKYYTSNDETYPFTYNDGVLTSTNKKDSSESIFTIIANDDVSISFKYRVSAESYDKLIILKDSKQLMSITGNTNTSYNNSPLYTLSKGEKLIFKYTKDSSVSKEDDCVYIKDIFINGSLMFLNGEEISIGDYAFSNCSGLTRIYYTETETEWNSISIGSNNTCLTDATRYYYSEKTPTTEGNYWHYQTNGFRLSCGREYMIDSLYTKITNDGKINAIDVNLTGMIEATSGKIGGCTIKNGVLQVTNANISGTIDADYLDIDGITAEDVDITGTITATSGQIGNLYISEDGYIHYNNPTTNNINGVKITQDAILSTTIAAEEGRLGGWQFDKYKLYSFYNSGDCETQLSSDSITCYTDGGRTEDTCRWLNVVWEVNNSTSDERVKKDIEVLPEQYEILFDSLLPKRYKYIDGTSNRYHTGYIAQDVVKAIATAGLDTSDFAAVMLEHEGTDKECWKLRRDEFVSLNTWQIQKAKKRITELEKRVEQLESLINKEEKEK